MQNSVGQQNTPQYQVPQSQYPQQPNIQYASQPAQTQNLQVPNYSGVNIQIFNPSVTAPGSTPVYNVNAPNYSQNPGCYPGGYYTGQWGQGAQNGQNSQNTNTTNTTENISTQKKTEKREIVQLTDDYIRTLENYLNSQDKKIRMMGAQEVFARLDEDHSRRDDKALNALINKMLQDPYTPIRTIALGAVERRIASGDNITVQILEQMRNSKSGYGEDALDANDALLKMAGQTVEKEFEVKSEKKEKNKG